MFDKITIQFGDRTTFDRAIDILNENKLRGMFDVGHSDKLISFFGKLSYMFGTSVLHVHDIKLNADYLLLRD